MNGLRNVLRPVTTASFATGIAWAALVFGAVACGYSGPKVDAEGLKRMMETDGAALLILDVRPRSQFDERHIEGARNIPLESLPALTGGIVKSRRKIAVICTCGKRSLEAVHLLNKAGGDPILVEGGMTAWEAAGFPTVSSERIGR